MRIAFVVFCLLSFQSVAKEACGAKPTLEATLDSISLVRPVASHYCGMSLSMWMTDSKFPAQKHKVVGVLKRIMHHNINDKVAVELQVIQGSSTTVSFLYWRTEFGLQRIEIPTFSSNMGYVEISKTSQQQWIVTTRQHHMDPNCRWISEEIFRYQDNQFVSLGENPYDRSECLKPTNN